MSAEGAVMAGVEDTRGRAVDRGRRRALARSAWVSLASWLLAIPIGFPIYWMVVSSFKTQSAIFDSSPTLWPKHVVLEHYRALRGLGVGTWLMNSAIVCLGTVAIVVALGTVGAYSLTRFRYPGRSIISGAVLYSYLFPTTMMVVPLFVVISRLNLVDTRWALILANMTFGLPFAIWLLRAYFDGLSPHIEDAAHIDGAGYFRAFVDVVAPQIAPGVFAASIFVAITTWNNYLFALVFLTSSGKYTIPVGLASLESGLRLQWGQLMATSVVSSIPVLLFFLLVHKRFFAGFSLQYSR